VKRVAILTINDYYNYGNRLQNYAAQEVITSLGFEVVTIINTRHTSNYNGKNNLKSKLQKLKGMSNKGKFELIKTKIWNQINKEKIKDNKAKRIKAFKEFTASNITETNYSISDYDTPSDLSDRFDFFITGSDQVWNPIFGYGSPIDFLTFAPKHKRIAYAPSFGISIIPEEYVKNYSLWLSEIENLSVREETGAQIIKELTGRDAAVLVDPTMMLSKEKWLSISKKASNKPKNQYLLTYFLGKVTKENRKRMKQIALDNQLQIVNLEDIKDRNTYFTDPSEFIDYVNSASVFFTDSFHGAVFSILLETPFVIFDRIENIASMNSRIDTLLSTFNLSSRKWNIIRNNSDIFNVDYSHVAPILEFERNKAFDYLKQALHVKDEI